MDQNHALRQLGYYDRIKGVSHAEVTALAFRILMQDMEGYGNRLSEDHRAALLEVLASYTKMAQGVLQGRFAFPLDTGMGKTQSVVAWIVALHRLGVRHIAVAVSASKVEALCGLKRKLQAHGVPEEAIGLVHSYRHEPTLAAGPLPEGYASLPSTGDHDGKQFLLITHQRVRGTAGIEQFNTYQGRPRDLLVYDESLFISSARAVSERAIRAETEWLAVVKESDVAFQPLLRFLSDSVSIIREELGSQRQGHAPRPVALRVMDGEAALYRSQLQYDARLAPLRDLLDMARAPLRIVLTSEGEGVVTYNDVAVPPELANIIVLDASYPIRLLERLDSTIRDGSRVWADGKQAKGIKRYSNVTVRLMDTWGGRNSITADFREKRREDRKVSRAICDLVQAIPREEAIIVFTFLKRDVDFARVLKRDLEAAGVDLNATVNVDGIERPRFVWLTWGQETSLSEHSYASNVVLAGVLHRSRVELAGAVVGQSQDLLRPVDSDLVSEVVASEVAHAAYQALSRGACRVVEEGEARAMRAWVFLKDRSVRAFLRKAMPGVRLVVEGDGCDAVADRIATHLRGLAPEVSKVTSHALKRAAGLLDVTDTTFRRARDEAAGLVGWALQGRSLVRS